MTPPPDQPPRNQRLGRGLEALLGAIPGARPAPAPPGAPATEPQSIPVAAIKANPVQPRREFKDAELDELASSLSTHGLLQPILVRPSISGFELVAGERRLRAAAKLGWESIPAVVRPIPDNALLTLALVENLQRSDLNPIEEAEGYQQLITDFGLTQTQIAEALAKDRSTIANALRLLQLPSTIRAMLVGGQLTMGHARALLSLPDDNARVELARQAVARGYTVRDLERLTKSSATNGRAAAKRETAPPATRPAAHAAQLQQLTDSLRRHLQTDVRLQSDDGKSGEIHIRFYTVDDLERILDRIIGSSNRTH